MYARIQRPGRNPVNDLRHPWVGGEVDEGVDLGEGLGQLVRRAGHQAPRQDEPLQARGLLERGKVERLLDRLAASRIDEPAGVDEHDVRSIEVIRDVVPPRREQTSEPLGVDRVLRAPERDDRDLCHYVRESTSSGRLKLTTVPPGEPMS